MADSVPISPVASRTPGSRIPISSDPAAGNDLEQVQSTNSSLKLQDTPPNGGYGWVCVACSAMINGQSSPPCICLPLLI